MEDQRSRGRVQQRLLGSSSAPMSKNLLDSTSTRARARAAMLRICSSCAHSSATAAATGTFRLTGPERTRRRDPRARPRPERMLGGLGGGTKIRRVASSGRPRPPQRHPGTLASPNDVCVRLVVWGEERSSRGGAFVLRGLPLSCRASLYL